MLSLRSPIGLGAALSASLAASLLSISPAKADNQAPGGGFPGGIEGTSNVSSCESFEIIPGFVSGATVFSTNFACQAGDKIYSNFENLSASDKLSSALYQFTVVGTNHTIKATNNFTPGTYSLGYKMTIFDALATGQRLASVSTTASSSSQNPPINSVPQWEKTLAVETDDENIDLLTTQDANTVTTDSPKLFGVAVRPTSANFISTLLVKNVPGQPNAVDSFSDTVIQLKNDEETVPGPLPILGAAAAFGFSRKLRSRIKQTV